MTHVLDASAMLAYLRSEPGGDRVFDVLRNRPVIATLNLGEVAHRLSLLGWEHGETLDLLDELPVTIVDVDRQLAIDAGFAVALTKPWGASLADRICLMLARRLSMPVLTGDRKWLEFADVLGVRVELFR